MALYEGFFIFPPESTPEIRNKQDKSLEETIRKFQGSMIQKNEGGKRPLGYPIKKFKEGFFVVADFELAPSKVGEFRHALSLQEDFLKFMITRKPVSMKKEPSEKAKPHPAKPTQPIATGQPQS